MTLEQFEKDLEEKLARMTDEELKTSLRRAGVKFEDDLLVEYKSPVGPYWYHPDHPICQDGQVLWEFPDSEDDSEIDYKTSLKNDY